MKSIVCFYFGFVSIILATFAAKTTGVVIDCYARTKKAYDGHQQTTEDGTPCIRWDSTDYKSSQFPDASVSDAANFCRAVGANYIWCKTSGYFPTWNECGIEKCDQIRLSNCGTLKIEQPALLGRNVTFTFTPNTYNRNAILEWQRSNRDNPWYTRPFTYKFTQFYENGTYYMILTDSVHTNDEVYYRIHYYNETTHCWMETKRLQLDDYPNNACGFVYARNDRILVGEEVYLEYYPSKNVLEHPDKFMCKWTRSRNGQTFDIPHGDNICVDKKQANGMRVLTLSGATSDLDGNYSVHCGDDEAGITNEVSVVVKVPPSAPVFQGLQEIDGCKKCIVGYDRENIKVHCKTNGGTEPVSVNVEVKNNNFQALQNNTDLSDYVAFFTLSVQYHNSTIRCSVMNAALISPLITTANVYVIRPPADVELSVPSELTEGSNAHIKCLIPSSRPSSIGYFDISGTNVSSAKVITIYNEAQSLYNKTVTLTSLKREWNGKNISCCRYSKWYKPSSKCSEPKKINMLYPPNIEFNITGSILNISKGDRAHVKCLADSVPASSISWIEKSKVEDSLINKCNGGQECGIDINADVVSKRQFVCATRYMQQKDNKTLIVNIQLSRKQNQLSDNVARSENFTNGTFILITLGACIALVMMITIMVIVIRKKRNTVQGKHDKHQMENKRNSPPPRENEDNEPGNDVANVDEQLEVTYSQPIKKKKVSVVCDDIYSKVDKTRTRNQQVAEGQRSEDGQLMYIDLEFSANESTQKDAITTGRNSPTEYVAIDFVKTASYVANENETTDMENVYANQQNV